MRGMSRNRAVPDAQPKSNPNSLRYLGLGGAAYRTRTCDPRITKASDDFGKSVMIDRLRSETG